MKNSYLTRRFEESLKKNIDELPLAYIWDRLAAFVLDLIVVSFIANVTLSPIKKKIQAAILNEHDGAVNFYVLCIMLGVFAIFIAYHTLSVFLFQKTIGKKIFKMEVAPIVYGQPISLTHAFIRSCALLVSILFLFFPLLEVFSNRLRRPMHDRLADSYVKGVGKTGTSPSMVEKLWVRLVYVIVVANAFALIAIQMLFFKQDIQNLSEFVTQPEYLCESVSEAKENWPKNQKVTRLDVALTLYGVDAVSDECLEKESQRAMSYGEELDKAYLGKAFVYESQSKVSDKYLKKVCEVNAKGDACALTQMITFWSEKDWKGADLLLANQKMKDSFLKVWALKHYDKTQNYEKLLALSDELWPNRALNDFIGKYKTLTLWRMDRTSESKELFQNIYGYLSEERRVPFVSEVCNLEIEKGCAIGEFSGCKLLVNNMKTESSEYIQEESLLTYIKTNKCGLTNVDDIIAEMRMYIDDPKIQMYLAAVKAQNSGKKTVAQQIYKNILRTTSASSFLSYEARSNLMETVDGADFIEQVDWWLKSDAIGSYHQQLGAKLLKILSEKRDWKTAEPVAQKMMATLSQTREQSELMAVVFYNSKKYSIAKKIVQGLERASTRAVASVEEFGKVKNELLKGEK